MTRRRKQGLAKIKKINELFMMNCFGIGETCLFSVVVSGVLVNLCCVLKAK